MEERSALDGLCSEKHTGESEVRLAKKQPLMHELGTTFCLSKNNKVDFERLKIFGHRKNGKKKDCECNFEKLGLINTTQIQSQTNMENMEINTRRVASTILSEQVIHILTSQFTSFLSVKITNTIL